MNENFTPPGPLNTAVLFLVFNRPDTTSKVFEAIRQAKPPRLYVAADGARAGRIGEAELVAKVREIATAVDWPCEVKTLFRDQNLGCGYAVSDAITWFFRQEQSGIILEDDCLPCPSFFQLCEWGLETYKNRKEVWQINGNNFSAEKSFYPGEVSFVSLPQAWGWATWSDRWEKYQKNPFLLQRNLDVQKWSLTRVAAINKQQHINALKKGLDTWDYQWQLIVLQNKGLVLSPRSNLISNLGDGEDATHTKHDKRVRLPTEALIPPRFSPIPSFNSDLNKFYEKKMGLRSRRKVKKILVTQVLNKTKSMTNNLKRKILFINVMPIVIVSTGRAGSTMMYKALIKALIASRFQNYPKWFQKFASRVAGEFLDDLRDIRNSYSPVLKSHDLFHEELEGMAKFIFIYGDPLDSAQSVTEMWKKNGVHWVEEHIAHLRGGGSPYDLYQKDILNYENQLKSWGDAKDVFAVHYDDLWFQQSQLSLFCGLSIKLPKRRRRSPKTLPPVYNEELFDKLTRLCQSLRKRNVL
jgi:hypothetical protein